MEGGCPAHSQARSGARCRPGGLRRRREPSLSGGKAGAQRDRLSLAPHGPVTAVSIVSPRRVAIADLVIALLPRPSSLAVQTSVQD